MKVSSSIKPEKAFEIVHSGRGYTVKFYDNIQSAPRADGMTGQTAPSWDYDQYELSVPVTPNLAAEIEADYSTWLQKAKDAELAAEQEKVREYRDDLLNDADLKFCNSEKWSKMTDDQRTAWAAYKQALRDVPGQGGFPYAVSWPAMPKEAVS